MSNSLIQKRVILLVLQVCIVLFFVTVVISKGNVYGNQVDNNIGITELISVNSHDNTIVGNNQSQIPSISADGRTIAFESDSTNLVLGNDTNNELDVFVHDRVLDETKQVSISSEGTKGNGRSNNASISGNGRFVAFTSASSNLVPNDINTCPWGVDPGTCPDIFVHDLAANTIINVSIKSDGSQANSASDVPSISTNGRFIAFVSRATNLVTDDVNGSKRDIFVHDSTLGKTELVSQSSNEEQGNDDSDIPAISGNGRYIAFIST